VRRRRVVVLRRVEGLRRTVRRRRVVVLRRVVGLRRVALRRRVVVLRRVVALRRAGALRRVVVLRRRVVVLRRAGEARRRAVVLRRPTVFRAAVVLRLVAIFFTPGLRRAVLRLALAEPERLFAAPFLLDDDRRGFKMTTSCSGMSIDLWQGPPTYKEDDKYD